MPIFVVRTTVGREAQVVDFLASNAKKTKSVHAVFFPHGMAGYILVEADNPDIIKEISAGVPYVGGVLRTQTKMEEIEHMVEFKPEHVEINKGDIVQIIAGPFKGEKAKVTRIDVQKSLVVLELLEAAVPIPITLNLDSVKVLTKAEQQEAEQPNKRDED